MRLSVPVLALGALFSAAEAEESFLSQDNGAALHELSGFVCPAKIGVFELDAYGKRENGDYCAYSGLSGLYGTVMLHPLPAAYDPAAGLAPEFRKVEGLGGHVVAETVQLVGPGDAPLSVFLRTYDVARLDALTYRTQFASAAAGAWAVDVIVEYAYPRDKEDQTAFITAIYGEAAKDLGAGP